MDKYYHFTKYEYLDQISEIGLIPQIGDRSISVNDDKKAVFVSKGELSAILMYFAMRWFYNSKKGESREESYDLAVEAIKYYDKKIERREKRSKKFGFLRKSIDELKKNREDAIATKERIENMDRYSSFEEYWGSGVYLSISNVSDVKYKHPDFHNCWVERTIEPNDISVVLLRNKETGELVDEKQKIIDYFMARVPLDDLFDEYKRTIGINDDKYTAHSSLKSFEKYYSDNGEEFKLLLDKYDLIERPLKEYIGIKTDKKKY